jgi:nucleoside-diphosphate-sugar epimerase
MANFLVTGAAGFIGSSLSRSLVESGHTVRGFDNLSTGKLENLDDVIGRIDFRESDLCDVAAVNGACKGIDYILHEAALPSVPRSVEDPMGAHQSNVTGTLNLLIAARDAGVKRIVFAGSSSAYGDQPTLPKHEDMIPNPISPYAASKVACEMYLQCFYRCYGLETVTVRYFNVFGPRQDANSQYSAVLAKFITMMLNGESPSIFGDGEQSRDFTYIDNVIKGNMLACLAPAEQVCGKVFNVATGSTITLNQTYALLQKLTGFKGAPIYLPERAGDIKHSYSEISKARAAFSYEPIVDFEEGLRRTIAWYVQQCNTVAKTAPMAYGK